MVMKYATTAASSITIRFGAGMKNTNLTRLAMFIVPILVGIVFAACSSSNTPTNPEPPEPDAKRLASVSGVVTGSSGLDVGSIAIGLTSESSSRTVVTSVDGTWRIDSVPPGSYTATPSKAGLNFTPQSAPVSVDTVIVTGVNFTARQAVSTGNRPDLVEIPAGEFVMGTGIEDESMLSANARKMRVIFSNNLFVAVTEVTQEQFRRVTGRNPSTTIVDNGPVNGLVLSDIVEYCNKLSEIEGLTPAYTLDAGGFQWDRSANGYRLPTDAEWEYFARAGDTNLTHQRTSFEDSSNPIEILLAIGDVAWIRFNSSNPPNYDDPVGPHAVAQKRPNSIGLYDVLGNVQELVFGRRVSTNDAFVLDPVGKVDLELPSIRGGSYISDLAAYRFFSQTQISERSPTNGFRIVRSR